jgi:putative endonuclease
MAQHNDRGREAEELSAEYLITKGFQILHRNWRFFQKEIDIVAEKDGELIIVEVKSRFGIDRVSADELLSRGKQRFIVDAAEAYLLKFKIEKETRFDIVIVTFSAEGSTVEHIEGAFIPGVNW